MTTIDPLAADLDRLRTHYDTLARTHGYAPEAVQMSSLDSQERRHAILADVIRDPEASVLDFGCGTGHFGEVLRRDRGHRGRYTGYDLSPELVTLARTRHPWATFEVRDILAEGVGDTFDHVAISGVFNNRVADNWSFATRALSTLFPHVRRSLVFNMLSAYVDYTDESLWYVDPGVVFAWCKEHLSPAVSLRHDYEVKPGVLPFEFTIEVVRVPHAPRALHRG